MSGKQLISPPPLMLFVGFPFASERERASRVQMQLPSCNGMSPPSWSMLRRVVTCIGPNQKNQPNFDLYLVQGYKICHFPIVVSYLWIGQNQNNQPNLVLYLVRRFKIFVSVATLLLILASSDREFLWIGRSLVKYYVLHETEIQCQMAKLSYQQIIRLRGLGVR